MSRLLIRLVVIAVIVGVSWFGKQSRKSPHPSAAPGASEGRVEATGGTAGRNNWGRMDTLADHFARHGRDFGARDANEYAVQAAALLQRARAEGLPAKRDPDGSLRVFDPASGAFGAYNRDGTTRTFFKPGDRHYFDRQPGEPVDLRTVQ